MELILLRHGKAEKLVAGVVDFNRELTSAGRREVKDAVPGLTLYIESAAHVQIWTSPLPRARQTARLIAEGLGHAPLTERQEIAKGNLEELASLWEKTDNKDVIIVVGHEPFLSEWCTRLTGVTVPFKTASAAGIEIKDPKILQGKLRWFAHPGVLARLGKC